MNSLFPNSDRAKREARRRWQQSSAGQLMRELYAAKRNVERGGEIGEEFRRGFHAYRKFGFSSQVQRLIRNKTFGGLASEVMRYGRGSPAALSALQPLFRQLGPLGSLLSAMLTVRGKTQDKGIHAELEAAKQFIEAFGGDVRLPKRIERVGTGRAGLKGPPRTRATAGQVQQSVEDAKKLLLSHGYKVEEPEPAGFAPEAPPRYKPVEVTYPSGVPKETAKGTPRRVVELDISGAKRRFPITHPIVTKAMVRSPESSNVYAYSYDYDASRLFIRFKQPEKYGGGAGPLYAYEHVPAQIFLDMYKPGSKGKFVWQNIRRPGTVSGHQYDYRLVSVRGGYVPRKATTVRSVDGRLEEWYVMRRIRARNLKTGKIERLQSGLPMRATPYRAEPNRG